MYWRELFRKKPSKHSQFATEKCRTPFRYRISKKQYPRFRNYLKYVKKKKVNQWVGNTFEHSFSSPNLKFRLTFCADNRHIRKWKLLLNVSDTSGTTQLQKCFEWCFMSAKKSFFKLVEKKYWLSEKKRRHLLLSVTIITWPGGFFVSKAIKKAARVVQRAPSEVTGVDCNSDWSKTKLVIHGVYRLGRRNKVAITELQAPDREKVLQFLECQTKFYIFCCSVHESNEQFEIRITWSNY